MKFENTDIWGFEHALRGMRNPMNSWNKADSYYGCSSIPNKNRRCNNCLYDCDDYNTKYIIGQNDMQLAQKLIKAGTEHRKFMRQIFVSVDITAPSYFMAELDTYKIGTVRNSTSFMHKGVSKSFEIEDFEIDDERIIDILSTRKIKEKNDLYYPYETEEYKIYTTQNNRRYEIYKNGKVFSCPFSYTDTKGRTMSSKITPFDKLKIREMYQDGLNQKQISERYNISQSQVSVVLRNVKNTSDNYELFEECWIWEQILDTLNYLRERYLETKDYKYFRKIRQILPQSYLYTSTITMSYENIYTMVHQRKSHKLNEWSGQDNPKLPNFISWARTLPYAQELIFIDEIE